MATYGCILLLCHFSNATPRFFFPFSSVLRRFYILSVPKVRAGFPCDVSALCLYRSMIHVRIKSVSPFVPFDSCIFTVHFPFCVHLSSLLSSLSALPYIAIFYRVLPFNKFPTFRSLNKRALFSLLCDYHRQQVMSLRPHF